MNEIPLELTGIEFDDQIRFHLYGVRNVGEFGNADERAKDDAVLQNRALEFFEAYPIQTKLYKQYVSAQMLKAVYRRAQDFDWY